MRVGLLLTLIILGTPALADEEAGFFQQHVAPLLSRHCVSCHNDAQAEGGLSFSTRRSMLKGGDSGVAVVAGDPDASLLIEKVSGDEPEMPQDGDPLSGEQVRLLREWIATGAEWPDGDPLRAPVADLDWWSLQPLVQPDLPVLSEADSKWARTPVDAFVLAKLRAMDLAPSPEADRRTLIRRLYFDLIGLPPEYDAIEAFVHDPDPKAYEHLVDRLLDSPHYGERWARYWLDIVHYGDTHGYDKDKPRPNAWPYRDYVIRSLNDDKPYGRFVQEQVAGDVLWPDTQDGIEATGFISAGPWDLIGHEEVPESKIDGMVARHLDRDDMVTNTMNTFVSLTVQCARCHDHKFDPVTQEHYYSLQAVFASLDRADRRYDIDPVVSRRRRELTSEKERIDRRQQELLEQVAMLGGESLQALDSQLQQLRSDQQQPDDSLEDSGSRIAELEAQRQRLLEELIPESIRLAQRQVDEAGQRVDSELAALPTPATVYCGMVHTGGGAFRGTGHDGGKPRPIHILARGNVGSPGEVVSPGTIPVIASIDWRFQLPEDHREGERRAALAQWLVRPDNPLTWRSIVNRVWQYHFGRGLVDSPNDFGRMGQLPSHPELLDWLAADFRDQGQSLKRLHRMLVTSSVYRQVSDSNERFDEIDADNQFLWRMQRRALDAEAIRDSVLKVSGKLDQRLGGPPFQDFVVERPEHSPHYQYHLHDPNDPASHRRSVYRFLVRSQQQPFMQTLDCADPSDSVPKRSTTFSALQALTMLNNKLVVCMAEHFAARAAEYHPELEAQVRFIHREALGREPDAETVDELSEFAREFGLPYTCRLVMNLNEFVCVD